MWGGGSRALKDLSLAGREYEWELVTDRLERARSGRAQCVVVRGPAGIGKTRLFAEVRDNTEGFTVLHTTCQEGARRARYDAVRALFQPLGLNPDDAADSGLLHGSAVRAVPALFPDRAEAAVRTGFSADHMALHGLYGIVVNLVSSGPLMLVLDDAQWCDEHSLRWLNFLLRRADDMPLLVLLAHRRADVPDEAATALPAIVAQRDCTAVDLRPLAEAAVGEVVTRALAEPPDSGFVRACATMSGGNPLLLGRLLDELRRLGVRPDAAGVRVVEDVGRDVVTRLLLAWLADTPLDVRGVARAVAVLGGSADVRSVAALAGVSVRQATEIVNILRRNDIVAESGMDFVHDVVRSGVLSDVPADELRRLRSRAARLLDEAGRPAEDVARVLLELPALDERWMLGALRDAAASAPPEAATRYLHRALEAETVPSERMRIKADLGRALARVNPSEALPVLREVLGGVTNPVLFAHAALEFAKAAFRTRRHAEAVQVLGEALELLPADGTAAPAQQELRTLVSAMRMIIGTGTKSSFEMVRRERSTLVLPEGNTVAERRLLGVVAAVGAMAGEPAAQLARQARVALRGWDFDDDSWAHSALFTLLLADEVEEVSSVLERPAAVTEPRAVPWGCSYSLAWRARFHHFLGTVREAAAEARRAVEIRERDDSNTPAVSEYIVWADVLAERGENAVADRVLDRINGDLFEEATLEWPQFLHTLARIRWFREDHEAALDCLLRCGQSMDESCIANPVLVPWRTDAAGVLVELGQRSEAAELVEHNEELARRWGTARAIGVQTMTRGVVAEGRHAVELLTEAVEILADSPARLEEARAELHLGAALLRMDDVREARGHLRNAMDLATVCGSRVIANRARKLGANAGGRMGQVAESVIDLLTRSEHRVATMAGAGRSNREIAEELIVTVRTIESHLTNVYRKLRVSSREELAEVLGRPRRDRE